jgi:microfibrillar-associated protein 1
MSQFSTKDLALLLPDEVDAFSMRHTQDSDALDTFVAPKPKIDASKKVTRYFPGKAPEWVDPAAEAGKKAGAAGDATQPVIVDRRLARLAKATAAAASASASSPAGAGGRRRYEAMVIEEAVDASATTPGIGIDYAFESDTIEVAASDRLDDEDDIAARRRRIKERLAAAAAAEASAAPLVPAVAQESESEYETDSSEDESEEEDRVLMRPVFVPKFRRQTIADKEAEEEKIHLKVAEEKVLGEEKKRATHVMVAESVRRLEDMDNLSLQAATDVDSDAGCPDDGDDEDDEEAYQDWKLREMGRIKREADVRIEDVLDKAELIRRRNMSADERYAEDLKNGRFDKRDKAKWGYLQKYYHKGAFYMDDTSVRKTENDVRKKDYYEPTLEDKFNKEALPAVMQVKNFGKRGRTKYTHLLDQDTTRSEAPTLHKDKMNMSNDNGIMKSYMDKRGGVGDVEKPFAKRAKKE